MATKLARTGTSSTNATKFTWSAWVKKSSTGSTQMLLYNYLDGNNKSQLAFLDNEKLYYYDKDGGDLQAEVTTTARYRDCNGWYHICLIGDSTDGTQGDRIQLYVNGVRQTMTGTYPDANDSLGMKVHTGTNHHVIGTNADSTSNPFSGIMSHVHYVDGIDYPATTFGSVDSTTGEWKINTSPSISTSDYGNNGYFILKDTNSGTDQSGNSHNLTVTSGTLTKTEDCPDNVFATWNANLRQNSTASFAYGNTAQTTNSSHQADVTASGFTTLGMTKGKWYAEFKMNAASYTILGVSCDINSNQQGSTGNMYSFIYNNKGFAYYSEDGKAAYNNGTNQFVSYGNTYATGDIIGIALDLDNYKLYFSKNGVWQNSGDPTSGSTGTGSTQAAGTPALPTFTGDNEYFFCHADYSQTAQSQVFANFGNGYFGTTAVASAGTNASGIGIFEYDVPAGYTALSTKGLNL